MMNKDKQKRAGLSSHKRLMELLQQSSKAQAWGVEESCVEEVEDLGESISLFDNDRLSRLVRAALDVEEWPFRG